MSFSPLPLLLLLAPMASGAATGDESPWKFRPTLLLQYDLVHADSDTVDGWRRLRPGLDLRRDDARLRLEYDTEGKRWTHAWVEVAAGSGRRLRIGQFKPPAGLEELSSGHLQMFMERSASRTLASAGRRLGVQLDSDFGPFSAQLMLGGKSVDRAPAGRLFAARMFRQSSTRHLGVSASREFPQGSSRRLLFRPEISLISGGTLDTGSVDGVRHVDRAGLETVWLNGTWSFFGEALWARLHRTQATDIEGGGGHVSVSWTPGGPGRSLRQGMLQAPRADSAVVWEFGVRLAHADLDLPGDVDGHSDSITFGVNAWLPGGGSIALNQVRSRTGASGDRHRRSMTGLRLSWWF